MVDVDPTDHEIADLGPKVNGVDDLGELEAMLELEREGPDRDPVRTLIESRIEKLESEAEGGDEAVDPAAVDPGELSIAEVANMVRGVDDPDVLRDLLDRERDGEDRDGAVTRIESRIEAIEGTEKGDDEGEAEYVPPEEKHPDLDHPTADKTYVEGVSGETYRDMWVYCETQRGELVDASKEILGKADELMDGYAERYGDEEDVIAVLIGDDVADLAEEAIACGADRAVYHEDDRLDRFRHKPYAELFVHMCRDFEAEWRDYHEPRYNVFPATHNGRDLSALVQAELDSGLASDCSDLYIEEAMISNPAKTGSAGDSEEFERVLHMPRPDFSGFEYSTILCIDKPHRDFHPQGASVIPGTFDLPDPDPEREGEVVEHDLDLPDDWFQVDVLDHDRLEEGVDLTGHDVIVALGRGIGDDPTGGIELGLDLVDAFDDAALGLSRGVITASYEFAGHVEDYVGEERQIGESGQVVEPAVYVAAGISGAIQHKVGMDESDTIVAVNEDPEADIREFSDYFVEGDLFEVLPRLTAAVEGDGSVATMEGVADD
ncbi:electron transfer flavoprotein subunit alpha/FixB family protein [Halorubrum depositum]|uniref:electron transfer flavoprotein subunit alpha/FixB family protein n=1 Tax=Halorubrum depositum TaxID=2583992 RepID=UPI0011A7E27F|nr:electron transfer flavoprotein subunit alpha/FixB family protein [Halorubrum depositum]